MSALPEQRMSILTLGVSDVTASRRFYEGILGFEPFMTDGIVMYNLGGFAFGLWEREKLHDDIGLMGNTCPPGICPNFALAYNTRSEAEVDTVFERLRSADTEITRAPHKASWGGYSGYFLDPDGNAWEVVFNPFWKMDEAGKLVLPAPETAG